MSLINSSYFIGERVIPNRTAADVASTIANIIAVRENEYLIKSLGYELSKAFTAGLLAVSVDQRYLDILFGKEFTGLDARLKKWDGLISVTEAVPSIQIALSSANDIFFTVGIGLGIPVHGDDTYINTGLVGKDYKVTQRGYGPLEALKADNSNVDTADIQLNESGGFTWLNGIKFGGGDKYLIELISATLDVSNVAIAAQPVSPIADYVYYYWLKKEATQTTGLGEVKPEALNAAAVSSMEKMCATWNSMVAKTKLLAEFLMVSNSIYPEFNNHSGSDELEILTTRIIPYFN